MQNGALPRITTDVKTFLRKSFTKNNKLAVIVKINGSPRSSDLTRLHSWIGNYVNFRVYRISPSSFVQLKMKFAMKSPAFIPIKIYPPCNCVIRSHTALSTIQILSYFSLPKILPFMTITFSLIGLNSTSSFNFYDLLKYGLM